MAIDILTTLVSLVSILIASAALYTSVRRLSFQQEHARARVHIRIRESGTVKDTPDVKQILYRYEIKNVGSEVALDVKFSLDPVLRHDWTSAWFDWENNHTSPPNAPELSRGPLHYGISVLGAGEQIETNAGIGPEFWKAIEGGETKIRASFRSATSRDRSVDESVIRINETHDTSVNLRKLTRMSKSDRLVNAVDAIARRMPRGEANPRRVN